MKKKIFRFLFEKYEKKRLRAISKGYQYLKATDQLDFILRVKNEISNTEIVNVSASTSKFIFGIANKHSELIVRQYILSRFLSINFNKAALVSLGRSGTKLAYPLPTVWLKVLERNGIKVSYFRSSLLWIIQVFALYCKGIVSGGNVVLKSIIGMFNPESHSLGRYVFFDGLVNLNVPKSANAKSYDIISWYLQWDGRERDIDSIGHQAGQNLDLKIGKVSIKRLVHILPPLPSFILVLKYLWWFLVSTFLALMSLLRGRWWNAMIMTEAVKAHLIEIQDPSRLAREYLFNNSGWIYRPMWTYFAEDAGLKITFYFYSRNCENFKTPRGYPIQSNSWQVTNWPIYLVWNKEHVEFIRRCVSTDAIAKNVGPIWFQDNATRSFSIPERAVAVFDVQPHRECFYRMYGLDYEYYTGFNSIKFLEDINELLVLNKWTMVLKTKRNIGSIVDRRYKRVHERLIGQSDVVNVDPEISAMRVIESASAVISIPFTSTAMIAKSLGKPACFYDPIGLIQKDDRAACGIEIITGRSELEKWISKLDIKYAN